MFSAICSRSWVRTPGPPREPGAPHFRKECGVKLGAGIVVLPAAHAPLGPNVRVLQGGVIALRASIGQGDRAASTPLSESRRAPEGAASQGEVSERQVCHALATARDWKPSPISQRPVAGSAMQANLEGRALPLEYLAQFSAHPLQAPTETS